MTRPLVLILAQSSKTAMLCCDALTKKGIDAHIGAPSTNRFTQVDTFGVMPTLLILQGITPKNDIFENACIPAIVICDKDPALTGPEERYAHAIDYVAAPAAPEDIVESVARALITLGQNRKNVADKKFGRFIGTSRAMLDIYDVIERTAQSNAPVFITGESGTGKDVCAEAIHKFSKRSRKPFIALNCAAIPKELFESELFGHERGAFTGAFAHRIGAIEQAEGGTLFLDEVAEMPPEAQAKLLRFLQNFKYTGVGGSKEKKADVRIICATNKNPLDEIRNGTLREDLYYRLNVIPVHMPPLRCRPADIIDLADYFLKTYAREEQKNFSSFSPEAERFLTHHDWPGNVRQLQNAIRGIVVLYTGLTVDIGMLRGIFAQTGTQKTQATKSWDDTDVPLRPLRDIERDIIESAIAHCRGNIPKAAALLEISASTIYRKKLDWARGTSNLPNAF